MYNRSIILTKCFKRQFRSFDLKEKRVSGCENLEKVTHIWLYNLNNEYIESDALSHPRDSCQFFICILDNDILFCIIVCL